MIDLKLTDSGDLDFNGDSSRYDKCNISFYLAKYAPQRISFTCIPGIDDQTIKHSQSITFNTKKLDLDTDQAYIVQDIEESMQNLRIKLKTELGSVPYFTDLGSSLWKTRHQIYYGKNQGNILEQIKDIIEETISGCVDLEDTNDMSVDVYYSTTGTGHFADQTVGVDITYKGTTKLSFIL